MNFFLITVAILCTTTSPIKALECYSCEGQNDDACVTNPEATTTETCTFNQQCYTWRKHVGDSSGSSVTVKRGCTRSVVAISSSSGANFVSVSSSTCSSDLCNKNNVQQNFNFHQFDDVSKIFDEQNLDTKILEKNPAAYYFNPFNSVRYSGIPGNYFGNYPGYYPANYLFYGNGASAPDQAISLAPLYNLIAAALKQQLQSFPFNVANDDKPAEEI